MCEAVAQEIHRLLYAAGIAYDIALATVASIGAKLPQ